MRTNERRQPTGMGGLSSEQSKACTTAVLKKTGRLQDERRVSCHSTDSRCPRFTAPERSRPTTTRGLRAWSTIVPARCAGRVSPADVLRQV